MEDDEAGTKSSPKSFFQTLPGIITGIAAVITAVGGLILALNQTGCFGSRTTDKGFANEKPEAKVDNTTSANNAPGVQDKNADGQKVESISSNSKVSFSTEPIPYLAMQVAFSIKNATVQVLPNNEIFLQVKIKCVNESSSTYNWGTRGIRVKVGEDKFAPDDSSPTYAVSVYASSFKDLIFNFKLPANEKNFSLLFYDYYDGREIGSTSIKLM